MPRPRPSRLGGIQTDPAYNGDGNFKPSSAQANLTVAPSASVASLTLSRPSVAYGHENGEKLTVKVTSPQGGTPTGIVNIDIRTTLLCTVRLVKGTGSCTLFGQPPQAGQLSGQRLLRRQHLLRQPHLCHQDPEGNQVAALPGCLTRPAPAAASRARHGSSPGARGSRARRPNHCLRQAGFPDSIVSCARRFASAIFGCHPAVRYAAPDLGRHMSSHRIEAEVADEEIRLCGGGS